MFFVWVRSVLRDTTSSRAIPGPSRSLRRSRRTSSSRSLSGSMRSCCVGGRASTPLDARASSCAYAEAPAASPRASAAGASLAPRPGRPGRSPRVPRSRSRRRERRPRLRDRRPRDARAPGRRGSRGGFRRDGPAPPPRAAGRAVRARPAGPLPALRGIGDEQPGECGVLELADVSEVVLARQATRPRPGPALRRAGRARSACARAGPRSGARRARSRSDRAALPRPASGIAASISPSACRRRAFTMRDR